MLDGELHVHEAHHVERLGHEFRLALDLLDHDGGKAVGRQRAGGVARVHAGLFDVFHHAGDLDLMTASTSISTASSRKRSRSTGLSLETDTASFM